MALRRLGWAALGAAVAYRVAAEWRARGAPPPAIAWDRVGDVARLVASAGQVDRTADYPALVRASQEQITALTGWTVARDLGACAIAVDRHTWLDRLIPRIRLMMADLEDHYRQVIARSPGGWLARDLAAQALAVPLGIFLGGLANLVLGQYEVELLAAPPAETDVLFIDPNLEHVIDRFGLPGDQFRQFIALHETGHAFQFEVFPWFRADLADAVRTIISSILAHAAGQDGLSWDFLRSMLFGTGGDEEMRRLIDRIQARMALAEGTSNFFMHRIGARVLPAYSQIAEVSARRTRSVSRRILSMLGMHRKFEQYALGEQFVATIVERRGLPALTLAWQSVETTPTLDEIMAPDRWLARVADQP